MDKQDTMHRSLMALFATFGVDADADLIRGYIIGIGDLSAEQLQESVFRAIRECDRLPRPAELRKLVGEGNDPEALAIAAWGDVLKAVPAGSWKSVDFADRAINAAIRLMGGWPMLIERFSDSESEKWARIEFIRSYRAVSSRLLDGEACRPLAGLSEKQVVDGRIVDPVPVRIGCDSARLRLAGETKQSAIARAV